MKGKDKRKGRERKGKEKKKRKEKKKKIIKKINTTPYTMLKYIPVDIKQIKDLFDLKEYQTRRDETRGFPSLSFFVFHFSF